MSPKYGVEMNLLPSTRGGIGLKNLLKEMFIYIFRNEN